MPAEALLPDSLQFQGPGANESCFWAGPPARLASWNQPPLYERKKKQNGIKQETERQRERERRREKEKEREGERRRERERESERELAKPNQFVPRCTQLATKPALFSDGMQLAGKADRKDKQRHIYRH